MMVENSKIAPEAKYKVFIKADIETVWTELIRTDRPLPFFFGSVCDTPGLAKGAPIRMRSPNGKYTSVIGDITEFEPPFRYAHTFRFTHLEDEPCHVSYDLRKVDGGTEFTLTTTNVPVGTKTEKSMAQGGNFIVDNLKALVETGKPTGSGRIILMLIRIMGPFSPAITKSENWPF